MKLRLVEKNKEMFLLCSNRSKIPATTELLKSFLMEFKKPSFFKGDQYWNCADINEVPGRTIAYVDDKLNLIVLDNILFRDIIDSTELVSASEYASLHGKKAGNIKKLCGKKRIKGAYKTTAGWHIPKNAPYPERKQRETKSKK